MFLLEIFYKLSLIIMACIVSGYMLVNKLNITLENLYYIFSIIGTIILFVSVICVYKQIKSDHERSRREKAVILLFEWSKMLNRENSLARKIIQKLDFEQCRKLYNQECFTVNPDLYKLVKDLMKINQSDCDIKKDCCGYIRKNNTFNEPDTEETKRETGGILLSEEQIQILRWNAISYLNLLESILNGWFYAIADRECIEHQFDYLLDNQSGNNLIENFRKAAGGETAYPSIEAFVREYSNKKHQKLMKKRNIS